MVTGGGTSVLLAGPRGIVVSSTVISGALVFDLEAPFAQADVLIVDGRIDTVAANLSGRGDRVIDANGSILMPGLINAHTHSNQTIEKGLADRLPLDSWMVLASYGGAGARLSPHDGYVSASLGIVEMLRTGTTSVVDCVRVDRERWHESMDAVATAYVDSGMRATVAAQFADLDFFASLPEGILDSSAIERRDPVPTPIIMTELEAFLDRWQGRHPLVVPALGPSSLPRCSTELFAASVDLARTRGVALQTHLLSAKSQVVVAQERFGGSTVDYLARLEALESWVSLAHGIWISDEEIARLAETDAVLVHNPVSNLKLGAGVAPAPAMSRAGVTIALGSDGASSNDSQNMFETVKQAALVHRTGTTSDAWPSAMDVLGWCWMGGAKAMDRPLGRIAPGYDADVVLLKPGHLQTAPKEIVAQQLVYGELGSSVDTVIVDGDVILEDGEFTVLDEAGILGEAQALADRIWAGLPERQERFNAVKADLDTLEQAVARLDVGFERP
jgi:5-methylthioadenosine/S-adenosylhomocysteine deaminase